MRCHILICLAALQLTACNALTMEEAKQALEESRIASQALALSSSSTTITKSDSGIEVETDFTIGDAVKNHAEKIKEFIQSQIKCAEYKILSDGTLIVEYGVADGDCSYLGYTYSGSHSIRVEKVEQSQVVVHHEWEQFCNQHISVTGSADITWDRADKSRHIEHELEWTRLQDNRTGKGAGDRTQHALENDILQGITINGARSWEGELGRWDLAINNIEARWIDPVPQAGSWELDTPFDKSLSLNFDRVDDDTIGVTVESGNRSFEFNVSHRGVVTRAN